MIKKLHNQRLCSLSHVSFPKEDMLRFVCDNHGRVVFDISQKLPASSVWLQASVNAVEQAIDSKVFEAHFGLCKVPHDLHVSVQKQLSKKALSVLSMARKMGKLVAGFTKVKHCLEHKSVACLIQASDAANSSKQKLLFKDGSLPVFNICSSCELASVTNSAKQVYMVMLRSEDTLRLLPSVLKAQRYALGSC